MNEFSMPIKVGADQAPQLSTRASLTRRRPNCAVPCQVCFFASTKDLTGTSELELEVPADGSMAAIVETLRVRYPQLERLLPRCALAVNGEYVEVEDAQVADGDEVALLPPMSGG